jgi:hypothetical protein
VATNITAVGTAATNIAAIIAAPTEASNAAQSAIDAQASADAAAAIANAFIGTSTTSWTPTVGSKAFTTQSGELYTSGIYITVVSAAHPAEYGWGQVTSYSGTTLTVDVQLASGSTARADWNISLSGVRGATGATITVTSVIRTSGTGASGTTDTYTITYSDSSTATFTVYNGADGTGVGDMLLGTVQEVTAEKKFDKDKFSMKGTSTGKTIVSTANASATNYTITLPAEDGTFALRGSNTFTGAQNLALATVASSATTADIWGAAGNTINWTGTATTTAFPNAPQAGATRTLICAGACLFTAGANLLIDGVASVATVTCAAGDRIEVLALSTTQFKLTRLKADGTAQVGASSSGALILISSTNISSPVAAINFLSSFSATYDSYLVLCEGVQVNIADRPLIRMANSGSIDSGSNYYFAGWGGRNTGGIIYAQAVTYSATADHNIDASTAFSLNLQFSGVNGTGAKQLFANLSGLAIAYAYFANINTHYINNNAISGFQLYLNGGNNFTAGTIKIYGYSN